MREYEGLRFELKIRKAFLQSRYGVCRGHGRQQEPAGLVGEGDVLGVG